MPLIIPGLRYTLLGETLVTNIASTWVTLGYIFHSTFTNSIQTGGNALNNTNSIPKEFSLIFLKMHVKKILSYY